ncbi:MAG TPA: FG-GAP-like repeat-containing protein, partial [Anaerolineales bacterium]|nr:FG-GAP-like repeat-containing protein [Anaerolineales bacterium]
TGAFTVTVGVVDSDGGQGEDRVVVKVDEKGATQYMQYLPILLNFLGNPLNTPVISPAPNSVNEFSQGPISAKYGIHLLDTLVYTNSFVVHSMQMGIITGTFEHYLDYTSSTLKVTSAQPLPAGDTLQAILTTDLVGIMGIDVLHPDVPVIWQFQTVVIGGSGYMFPANTPTFGGGASTDLAWGDVDRDGDGDVLVSNTDQPTTVWLNDGQATFTPHPNTPNLGAGGVQALALGDLDNDGDVDVVLATLGEESVWLNDRQGNFSPHPTMPTFGAGASLDVVLGDLNGDSFLDALVANTNGEPETVWLNDGTGAFFPHPTMPIFGTGDSTSVALGDVDGDFDLDAVIANTNGEPETVWLNDTTGQFTPHGSVPEFGAEDSHAVRLGDLDADGDVDVVVANALGEPETVWMNDGTGGFFSYFLPASFGTGDSTDLALGDLDGDMDLDVVVANANGEPETVWMNDGVGGFSEHPGNPMFGEEDSQGVVLGDLEGDGGLDAIVANANGETVWLNTEMKVVTTSPAGNGGVISPNGTLVVTLDHPVDTSTITPQTFSVQGEYTGAYPGTYSFPAPNQVQFTPAMPFLPGEPIRATLTRLITSQTGLPLLPFTWEFYTAVSGGTGVYDLQPEPPFNAHLGQVVIGDLDGDRDLDVIMNEAIDFMNQPTIWLNDGNGNFLPHPNLPVLPVTTVQNIVLGDVDRDGDVDAVFATTTQTEVWLNDGTGEFSPHPASPEFGINGFVQLADLDSDGDLDALACNSSTCEVWLNDGTGNFSPHPVVPSFGDTYGYVYDLALGDLDQDGDIDAGIVTNGGANLWLNDGSGIFIPSPTNQDFGYFGAKVEFGDLDGDQDLDILLGFYCCQNPQIWINDGNGLFAPLATSFDADSVNDMTLGDLDGDGDLDVLFVVTFSTPSIWVNDGNGNFTQLPPFSTSLGIGQSVEVGDLDGDGDVDVILTGTTNSSVYLNQNE